MVSTCSVTPLPPGRPEKLPDVCYSWWVLSSLAMIGRLHWIDKVTVGLLVLLILYHMAVCGVQEKLAEFILACQDEETGGFADRPGDWVRTVALIWTVQKRSPCNLFIMTIF